MVFDSLTDYEHMITISFTARPKCSRKIGCQPGDTYFKPRDTPLTKSSEVELALDEFEAIRLADFEGLYQVEAARKMGISRPTFGRIVGAARHKIAKALVLGKALKTQARSTDIEIIKISGSKLYRVQ